MNMLKRRKIFKNCHLLHEKYYNFSSFGEMIVVQKLIYLYFISLYKDEGYLNNINIYMPCDDFNSLICDDCVDDVTEDGSEFMFDLFYSLQHLFGWEYFDFYLDEYAYEGNIFSIFKDRNLQNYLSDVDNFSGDFSLLGFSHSKLGKLLKVAGSKNKLVREIKKYLHCGFFGFNEYWELLGNKYGFVINSSEFIYCMTYCHDGYSLYYSFEFSFLVLTAVLMLLINETAKELALQIGFSWSW